MSMTDAKEKFYNIMRGLNNYNEQTEFLLWIEENWQIQHIINQKEETSKKLLECIACELRKLVPNSGILPSENIINRGGEINGNEHLDEFMYDWKYFQKNCTNYQCTKCGSKEVSCKNYITHSMSIERLQYVFKQLLPVFKGKKIVDVGSRAGAVLYGSFYLSSVESITGIECSSEWCKIQEKIVHKFEMGNRVSIVCDDVRNRPTLIEQADLVVLNNVFEYFTDENVEKECWSFIAKHMKPSSYLVLVPKAMEVFSKCKVDFNWTDWLTELNSDECEEYDDIGIYQVNGK